MYRHVEQLIVRREAIVAEQGSLFAQIISESNNPQLTASLLVRVTDTAVTYNELTKEMTQAVGRVSRTPSWIRYIFG